MVVGLALGEHVVQEALLTGVVLLLERVLLGVAEWDSQLGGGVEVPPGVVEGRGGLRGRRVRGVLELVASDALEAVVGLPASVDGRVEGSEGRSQTDAECKKARWRGNVVGFCAGIEKGSKRARKIGALLPFGEEAVEEGGLGVLALERVAFRLGHRVSVEDFRRGIHLGRGEGAGDVGARPDRLDDVVNSIQEPGFGGVGVGLLGGVVLGLELCADAERDARVALYCFGPGERGTAGEGGR